MSSSCILAQFAHFAELTQAEKDLLISLENNPKDYEAGETIRSAGELATMFYTLRSGWACAIRELADGERQVLDVFLPGQVMGLREVGYNKSLTTFITLGEAKVCPFPKKHLTDIFDQAPRLADLFFLIASREQSMLVERIINLGRRPAAERLAHFLLEIKTRLDQDCDEFELPMKQAVIGDALGLSVVHVSRTFKHLREEGLVSMTGGKVMISDMQKLMEFADFNPIYLENDIDWVRQSKKEGEVAL